MGWQDRDWAKFDDRELEQLYGVRRKTMPLREGAAAAVLVSLLATLAFGPLHLLRLSRPASSVNIAYPRNVMYGIRGTNAADPNGPDGTNSACTAASFDSAQGWVCQAWSIDTAGLPIVAATPYNGACANAKVDEASGSWSCLSASPASQQTTPSVPS